MKSGRDTARLFATKAEEDLALAEACLTYSLPLIPACFHVQQTAEKLLKALLSAEEVRAPWTHDLMELLDLAVIRHPELGAFRRSRAGFGLYAVDIRYDEVSGITPDTLRDDLAVVGRLRAAIHALLPPEARP
ncbi:MAG: HEPN domain-containing protein [Acidobacteria bacterium]|nr:HEPN domain-containing protein [Acidobacteriota bacterium]